MRERERMCLRGRERQRGRKRKIKEVLQDDLSAFKLNSQSSCVP